MMLIMWVFEKCGRVWGPGQCPDRPPQIPQLPPLLQLCGLRLKPLERRGGEGGHKRRSSAVTRRTCDRDPRSQCLRQPKPPSAACGSAALGSRRGIWWRGEVCRTTKTVGSPAGLWHPCRSSVPVWGGGALFNLVPGRCGASNALNWWVLGLSLCHPDGGTLRFLEERKFLKNK